MKTIAKFLSLVAFLVVATVAFTGCETTGDGNVSGSMYYGVGYYDPWYYGGYYDAPDIIVTPPAQPAAPARPAHPINPTPRPRPTPHIPMGARPSPRR
jgi:hypothetical protein